MPGREPCGVREDALAAEEDHQHEHDDLELQQARHRADERRCQLPVRRGQPLALQLVNAQANGAEHERGGDHPPERAAPAEDDVEVEHGDRHALRTRSLNCC